MDIRRSHLAVGGLIAIAALAAACDRSLDLCDPIVDAAGRTVLVVSIKAWSLDEERDVLYTMCPENNQLRLDTFKRWLDERPPSGREG